MPLKKLCPRCQSHDILRSHRRFYERIVPSLTAYRCEDCKHRFIILKALESRVRQA